MKKFYLLWVLFCFVFTGYSQHQEITLKSAKLKPAANVQEYIQGKRSLPDRSVFGGKHHVMIQFKGVPTQREVEMLKKQGVVLSDYLTGNSYFATITKGDISSKLAGGTLISINEIEPEWKMNPEIATGIIPEHAKISDTEAKVNILYFENADVTEVQNALRKLNIQVVSVAREFATITAEMPISMASELCSLPFIKAVEYVDPPMELENIQGRTMNRVNVLSSNTLGGRNLTGKGIKVGIWDGSIQAHPDMGNRLVTKEYEYMSAHGQHVAGTVAGSGMIDPRARGMAPGATIFGWNFNTQSNGLTAQQEMYNSARDNGIVITSNSYGVSLSCTSVSAYNAGDVALDQLVNGYYPYLTHVFSAGNDQDKCVGKPYASSTKRAKNVILVGAIDESTNMSWFSSWGPMNDGRILPHICSYGVDVYSTVYNNGYDGTYSGTSMATPAVSGTVALMYERYQQLKNEKPLASLIKAAILTTGEDRGNPGPDYSFGYGVIDGARAVSVLEKNRFVIGTVAQGANFAHNITVPAGATELKITLVWSDYQGTVNLTNALINNLNLSVSQGANTTLPWVLNPQNPSAHAVRGVDNLNNQEQVTIKNPAGGTYTINVTGADVPKGPQQFAVAYEYYMPELSLSYPIGGENFKPSDKPVARWNSYGYTGTFTLQLSTNNGVTFTTVATNLPNHVRDYVMTIPNVVTDKALVRIIQDGTMDISDAPFTIMTVPTNLALTPTNCGGSNWVLTWEAAAGAEKYEILKANVAEETYTKIGETTSLSYELPTLTTDRNIYTVKAVAGTVAGERAYAIIANPTLPVSVTAATLPLVENFETYPSSIVRTSNASGTKLIYNGSPFSYDKTHTILMQGIGTGKTLVTTGDVFQLNPTNLASAKICEIDATAVTGKLYLRAAALMVNTGAANAHLRLLANGTPVANNYGTTVQNSIASGQNVQYFDLSNMAGQKFSLEFQAVLANAKDSLQIGHLMVYQPKFDASISKVTLPTPALTLGTSNDIKVSVRNLSGETLTNVPVSYSINGGAPVNEVVAGPINAFQTLEYTFTAKANFSTTETAYTVRATVSLPGDEVASNNAMEATTANIGDYYLMPTTSTGNTKKVTTTVTRFTDNGGTVLNYTNSQFGRVVFSPTTTERKVKIKFTSLNLDGNTDVLVIRNGNLSTSPIIATLTGNSHNLPLEFYSNHSSGELMVEFTADKENNAPGWLAEVTEVAVTDINSNNSLTLDGINKYNGYYPTATDIRITVKNNTQSDLSNVRVQYKVNDGEWSTEEVIATVPKSTTTSYTFTQLVTLPLSQSHTITARILNEDELMDDNTRSTSVINDRYCISYSSYSSYATGGLFHITKVEKDGVSNETSTASSASSYPQYFRHVELPVYRDVATNNINVTVNNVNTSGKIAIWVDWNNDGDFVDAGEAMTVVPTNVTGKTTYPVSVVVPASVTAGNYVARVRITTVTTPDPCASEYSNNGEVEDYTINLMTNYPIAKDVAVIATNLVNGENLTATETVTATIKNNASVAISNFEVAFKHNGGAEVKELVSASIEPFGTYVYTFSGTADLSAVGPHTIEIYTLVAGDQVPENDKFTKTIFNEMPAVDGFFALNFDGVNDVVNAGTLGNADIQSFTQEAWINPASFGGYGSVGFGNIMRGKNLLLFITAGNSLYPQNSLIISSVGGMKAHFTNANTIKLNTWQHIAVSYNSTSKELKVYINGVEQQITEYTAGTVTAAANNASSTFLMGNSAALDRQFKGIIDEARVWSVVRSNTEIQNGMYVHQKGASGLVAEFSFDEGYYNSKTYSGSLVANIQNAELGNTNGSIWVEPTTLVREVRFDGQVTDLDETSPGVLTAEVSASTNLNAVAANWMTTYPNTVVKSGSVVQTPSTTNNFSNSMATPVNFEATATVFGKNLSQQAAFRLKYELSDACILNSFVIAKAVNAGLANDVTATTIIDNMVLAVAATDNTSALKPTFTISAGAKAYVNNTEIISGVTAIDFSQPVVITVVAANTRAKNYYSVTLQKTQTITWNPTTVRTYGEAAFDLNATASSGLSLTYVSDNNDIIMVGTEKAYIKGSGTVNITAVQQGNHTTASASTVQSFTVNKAVLTAKANDVAVDYTLPIPALTIAYSGFVYGENESVLIQLPVASTTATQASAPGTYPITVTGGAAKNYTITPVNGVLTINSASAYDVNFNVTSSGTPIEGATIEINGQTLTSSATGAATIKLINGTYNYSVTKPGYATFTGSVVINNANQAVNVALTLPLPVYTLTYTADQNGMILGAATQQVEKNSSGTEVTAVGNAGYEFEKWSDGSTANPRSDLNVQSNITVQAIFKLKSYTLTYLAGANGSLTGTTTQTVEHGSNATAVTAVPNTGFLFAQWSDGNKTNPRTDLNVSGELTVTAQFTKAYTLPYYQPFDATT